MLINVLEFGIKGLLVALLIASTFNICIGYVIKLIEVIMSYEDREENENSDGN